MWREVCDDSTCHDCENCADRDGDNCPSPPVLIRAGAKPEVPVYRNKEPAPEKHVAIFEVREIIEQPITRKSIQKLIDHYIDVLDHLQQKTHTKWTSRKQSSATYRKSQSQRHTLGL